MNTAEFLDISAMIVPERPAIIFEDKVTSFEDLNGRVNALAAALAKRGITDGKTVGLIQVNTNHCVEAYFATMKADGVYIPINFRARANEFTYMINTAEIEVLFVGDRYLSTIESIKGDIPTVQHFISLDKQQDGWETYEDLITEGQSEEPPYPTRGDADTSIVMYTGHPTPRHTLCRPCPQRFCRAGGSPARSPGTRHSG